MTLYITVGVPGAGKTTMSRRIEEETGAVRVSYDEARYSMRHQFYTPNGRMTHEERELVIVGRARDALLEGKDAIYDSLNLTKKERANILDACSVPDIKKVAIWMNTAADVVKQRRGFFSEKLLKKLEPPTTDEGFDEIWVFTEGGNQYADSTRA